MSYSHSFISTKELPLINGTLMRLVIYIMIESNSHLIFVLSSSALKLNWTGIVRNIHASLL